MSKIKYGLLTILIVLTACTIPFIGADLPTPISPSVEKNSMPNQSQATPVSIPTGITTRRLPVPGATATGAANLPTATATANAISPTPIVISTGIPSVVGPVPCGGRAQTPGMLVIPIKNWFDRPLVFTVDLLTSASIPEKPFNRTNTPYCFEIRPGVHKWKVSVDGQILEGQAEVPANGQFGLSFCPVKEGESGYITTQGCEPPCPTCPPGGASEGGNF